jgi:hypothetical protein
MQKDFEFFDGMFESTLKRQRELRSQFIDLLKSVPIFVAVIIYFMSKGDDLSVTHLGRLNYYSLGIFISIFLVGMYTTFLIKGLFLPPKYKVRQSPIELYKYWQDCCKTIEENPIPAGEKGLDDTVKYEYFRRALLTQTVEGAEVNYINNVEQNNLKNYAGYTLPAILISFIILAFLSF